MKAFTNDATASLPMSLADYHCLLFRSVHLAQRVLQLERANTSLRNEMEREKKKKDLLGKEVMLVQTTVINSYLFWLLFPANGKIKSCSFLYK